MKSKWEFRGRQYIDSLDVWVDIYRFEKYSVGVSYSQGEGSDGRNSRVTVSIQRLIKDAPLPKEKLALILSRFKIDMDKPYDTYKTKNFIINAETTYYEQNIETKN